MKSALIFTWSGFQDHELVYPYYRLLGDKFNVKIVGDKRDKQGRFVSRKSLNYLLARSIYNKGIRATMFFTKPFEAGLDKFSDEIVLGFVEDNLNIEEWVH